MWRYVSSVLESIQNIPFTIQIVSSVAGDYYIDAFKINATMDCMPGYCEPWDQDHGIRPVGGCCERALNHDSRIGEPADERLEAGYERKCASFQV